MSDPTFSLIVPIYNNAANIPELLDALEDMDAFLVDPLEVIFVIDGSRDNSSSMLEQNLPGKTYESRLVYHSRNYGAFSAVRTGLAYARGTYCAVMAADLQEPPELILEMFEQIQQSETDVVVAYRNNRDDPFFSRFFSACFWWLYRSFVIPDIPTGGIGTIACNQVFKQELLKLEEKGSSLIGLVYWLGFRRKEIPYDRKKRSRGKSGWSFSKKVNYFFDSLFSFSDLPIKVLITVGSIGFTLSSFMGLALFINKLFGSGAAVPGYIGTMVTILFFSCINIIGLGIIGAYVWRAFSNTQQRPSSIIMDEKHFPGKKTPDS
jgi:glycosyltransferase involved in cell wall biosynthesis